MLIYLFIVMGIFAVSWTYYLCISFNKQSTQQISLLKDVVKQQANLLIQHEKSLVAMNAEEQSSVHLLQQLEKSMYSLENRYQEMQFTTGKEKDYHQLSELIKKGFDHEEMMKSFGLSRGEIQLMKSLNKNKIPLGA